MKNAMLELRNNSWKSYCVVSFNMGCGYEYFITSGILPTYAKTHNSMTSMNYFDSDMYNTGSINTVYNLMRKTVYIISLKMGDIDI